MEYNIQQTDKTNWTNIVVETKQAIRQLETKIQDAYLILAAKKLKQLHYPLNNSNTVHKGQTYLAKNIHHNIKQNNAMITQADKEKILVIIYKQDYHNKVHTFLTDNKFQATPKSPTNEYQKTDHTNHITMQPNL